MFGLIHECINEVTTRPAENQRKRQDATRKRERSAQSGRHTTICLALLLIWPLDRAAAATQTASSNDGGWRPEQVELCADLQIPPDKLEDLAADAKPNKLELPKTSWRTTVFPRRNFLMCMAESSRITDQDKVRAANILVKKKVNIDLRDPLGYTALHLAVLGTAPMLAQFLLDQGASPDMANVRGETPLLLAVKTAHRPLIDLLMERGAVDHTDTYGRTPLFYAAANGDADTARRLIARGANPGGLSDNLLVTAAGGGSIDLFRYLVDELKMSVNVTSSDGRTLLMIAAAQNRLPMVRHLVEERAANIATTWPANEVALNFSTVLKNSKAKDSPDFPTEFPSVLASGAYDNVLRPIELVQGARHSALSLAAAAGNVDVMRYLMAHGATNSDSMPSALAVAAREARLDAVQLLIDAGADIGPGTDEVPGVMYWGAIGRDPRVLETLIARGAAMAPIPKNSTLLARALASRNYGLTLLAHQQPAEALPYLRDALAIYSRAVDDLAIRKETVMTATASGWGLKYVPAISDDFLYLEDGRLARGSFTIRYRNNTWRAVVVRDDRVYAFGPVSTFITVGDDRSVAFDRLNSEAQNARDSFLQFVTELTDRLECAKTAATSSTSSVGTPCVAPSR